MTLDPSFPNDPMPGNAINPACAAEIHNPDYNITQFGDSLSDLVDWFYGLASFNRYYEIMGLPNINVQNFGISGARSKTVAWNTTGDTLAESEEKSGRFAHKSGYPVHHLNDIPGFVVQILNHRV